MFVLAPVLPFFFFNDTATTEIYTLSLHDALPISSASGFSTSVCRPRSRHGCATARSEEHTSELQSRGHLVCRLLLEKKNEHQRPEAKEKDDDRQQRPSRRRRQQ